MTLIGRVWWLIAAVLALAVGGAVAVNLLSARDTLLDEVRLKNADNAQALALVLSQQDGDLARMALYVQAQADTGHYLYIRMLDAQGRLLHESRYDAPGGTAPSWFKALLPLEAAPGVAQVSDGWRALGRVQLATHVAHAHSSLWRGGWRALLWMIGVGLLAAGGAALAVRRLQRVLQGTVDQAQALCDGRYMTVAEPKLPELQRMSAAMNHMVVQVRDLIQAQSAQAEAWRRQAHCDPLTGLAHRRHFLDRLSALLQREDGADGGSLLLMRVAGLEAQNREHGHGRVDAALRALAGHLQRSADARPHALAGRLNGSDFALFIPAPGLDIASARELFEAMKKALSLGRRPAQVHLGQVPTQRGAEASTLMAMADAALAQAEAGPPFVLPEPAGQTMLGAAGEQDWRRRLLSALAEGGASLAEYPVRLADGRLLHLACTMRLLLDPGTPTMLAARWLPLALRCRLTTALDAEAVRLALAAIAADARPRCVHVAIATLADPGFLGRLQEQLDAAPDEAGSLSLELPEAAALDEPQALRSLTRSLRPLGVRVGLEHAGSRLHEVVDLQELGLAHVKLDAALSSGLAGHPAAEAFVRSTVSLLGALGTTVVAEGIQGPQDLERALDCGVAAYAGPWAETGRGAR